MSLALIWADALLRASVQSGVVAGAAWVVLRAIPCVSPSVCSWIWRLVALKFILTLFAPVSLEAPAPFIAPTSEPGIPLALGVGALSLLGLLNVLWTAAGEMHTISRARNGSMPVDPRILLQARNVARTMGLAHTPRIRQSDAIGVPALVGVWRPMILLPDTFLKTAGPDELRMVFAHELAHLRRRDLTWGWLGIAVRSIFFFHPLAWLTLREAQAADEAACDALAIQRLGASRREYGRLLLRLSVPEMAVPTLAAAVSSGAESVRRRIDAIARPSRPNLVLSSIILLLAMLALPGFRKVSPSISSPPSIADPRPAFSPAAPVAAASLGRRAPAQESLLVER